MATTSVKPVKDRKSKQAEADRERYFELVRRFPLRPIENEKELDAATDMIDELLDIGTRTKAEEDYLHVLSDLSHAYEERYHPMPEPTDYAMVRFLMEIKELSQAEVAKATGIAVSTVSEILSGKRAMTLGQMKKLAAYFHVSPAVFLPDAPATKK
jgi:HTH-type transcriptional regulator / antitoxin HigA